MEKLHKFLNKVKIFKNNINYKNKEKLLIVKLYILLDKYLMNIQNHCIKVKIMYFIIWIF
jgi:hypothetical protein